VKIQRSLKKGLALKKAKQFHFSLSEGESAVLIWFIAKLIRKWTISTHTRCTKFIQKYFSLSDIESSLLRTIWEIVVSGAHVVVSTTSPYLHHDSSKRSGRIVQQIIHLSFRFNRFTGARRFFDATIIARRGQHDGYIVWLVFAEIFGVDVCYPSERGLFDEVAVILDW